MDVPKEVIERHAYREAAEYFANKIAERRKNGQVAILVENMYDAILYINCNERGYPQFHTLRTLELPRLSEYLVVGDIPPPSQIECFETDIQVEKPLLSYRYDYMDYPTVFMWSGRRLGTSRIPAEKLNVQELMRVAQAAIKGREGLVIDDALKNKLYK